MAQFGAHIITHIYLNMLLLPLLLKKCVATRVTLYQLLITMTRLKFWYLTNIYY